MTDLQLNRLLAMLPESVVQRLEHAATVVSAAAGDVLLDAGEPIEHVFFPLDAVVSLDQVISEDVDEHARGPCVALVGLEGVVGIESFLGFNEAINRATVRVSGRLARFEVAPVREEFSRTGALHRLVVGSAGALIGQTCAIGACERVHSVRQRVVRWLLMFADRAQGPELPLTQELLSHLIGVRRASISAAAAELQAEDLIAYQRGSVILSDRDRLEAGACRCYREIKARYTDYVDAA
ncbi:MAG: helix-turn-helix domain-containing protein [Mycobacteriales bacterium]